MQFLNILPNWVVPRSSSLMWKSRRIDLDFDIADTTDLCVATALALRYHACGDTIAFDVVNSSDRKQIVVPVLDDNSSTSWRPTLQPPTERVFVALCIDDSSSPVELAASLPVPVLISRRSLLENSLEITFNSGSVSACIAGWLLIHIAHALHHIQTRCEHLLANGLSTGFAEQFLFSDEPFATRYKRLTGLMSFPKGGLLQDCFGERAKADPLSPAISFTNIEGGTIFPGRTVTYATLHAIAVRLALQLRSVGIGAGHVVPICVKESAHVALSMLAVVIAGAAFVITDPDSTSPTQLLSLCSEMSSIIVVLLQRSLHDSCQHIPGLTFIDPSDYFQETPAPAILSGQTPNGKGVKPPGDTQLSLILPCVDTSAIAYFVPQLGSDGRTTWAHVNHRDATASLQRRYVEFGRGWGLRFLPLHGPRDEFLGVNLWHTFVHGATLCAIPHYDDDSRSITSLLSTLACTHMALSLDHFQRVSSRITEEFATRNGELKSDQAKAFQDRLPLRTLLLAKPPQSRWEEEPLFHMGLRLMTYHTEPTDTVGSTSRDSAIEPIKVLLPEGQDPIINPLRVLELLPFGTALHDVGTRVVKITEDMVVKYGPSVRVAEARNALYVQECTGIPVPSVHLVFTKGHNTYIVMQCIRGHDLQHHWQLLGDSQRLAVTSQLAAYIRELHNLVSPSGHPGPLDKGRCHGRWFTIYGAGPFETHVQLVAWLNRKLGTQNEAIDRFRDRLPLVFTHQDLAPRNLILDESHKLWIIDWDLAGWYPVYFDYACIASDVGTPEHPVPKGWADAILPLLPNYEREYRSLQAIRWALDVTPFS